MISRTDIDLKKMRVDKIKGGFKMNKIIKWVEKKLSYKPTFTWRVDNAEDWNNLEELRAMLNEKKEVIITVRGGVAEPYEISDGVSVKIVDLDVDGVEEDRLEDFDGEEALVGTYGKQ